MWYVYFLALSNGDIYIGSTNDLRRRVESYQQGHVESTKQYLPAVLRSYVAVADEATARSLERYFKSGSGKAFAKKRFPNTWPYRLWLKRSRSCTPVFPPMLYATPLACPAYLQDKPASIELQKPQRVGSRAWA